MKAILLAGGKGTRLRPLTLHTPKPIVPIFDRPFLQYQIDLLRQVPEIDEIVLSLNYQPRRIEEVFGDGSDLGIHLRYVVEPHAARHRRRDQVRRRRRPRRADRRVQRRRVHVGGSAGRARAASRAQGQGHDRPDAGGQSRRPTAWSRPTRTATSSAFVEKPTPDQIRCDTINAGIYVLEPDTLDRIPERHACTRSSAATSRRSSQNRETFVAYVYRGYWIDIGTPEKYRQAHRDIMDGRFVGAAVRAARRHRASSRRTRGSTTGATIEGPCFIDAGAVVKAGARIGPYIVIGRHCHIGENAVVDGAILWPNTWVDSEARLGGRDRRPALPLRPQRRDRRRRDVRRQVAS